MTEGVPELVYLVRQRRQLHCAELRLVNQIAAFHRLEVMAAPDVDSFERELTTEVVTLERPKRQTITTDQAMAWGIKPLVDSADYLGYHRKVVSTKIAALAERLPVWSTFAAEVRGFGPLSLGLVVGETGDLSNYSSPAKVWKRLGLSVGEDGRAQRRIANDPEAAMRAGYSPRRRTIMHLVGECLLRLQGEDGLYKQVYAARKAYERERAPDMRLIVAHRRGMRVMEKRLLKDLWRAWRRQALAKLSPSDTLPVGATDAEGVPL